MRGKVVALILFACSMWSEESWATVLSWSFGVENTTASETNYSFLLTGSTPAFGSVNARLSYGMAVGDGARDGATVELFNGDPIVRGFLNHGGTLSNVASAGTAQSYNGEGGTAGQVVMGRVGVTEAVPTAYSFLITDSPVSAVGRNTLVQSTLARAFADGEEPNGGSMNAAFYPDVMLAKLYSGSTAVATLDLGADTAFPPDAGAFGPESASALANCSSAACDRLEQYASFFLSPEDNAALLVRTEIGGTALTGPVAWTSAAFDDGVFDCGVIGCSQMEVLVSFTLSAGDSLVIAGRFDVEPATVPEPVPLPMLGLGLVVIGLSMRKRIADSPR